MHGRFMPAPRGSDNQKGFLAGPRGLAFARMNRVHHPALERFLADLGGELVLGQVLLRRAEGGFELRHDRDRHAPVSALRGVAVEGLRALAQHTAGGAFRPLKAAPNLAAGWRARAANPAELERALEQLYPGALADWFAARSPRPPVTGYRDFTARQTGMYRVTTHLTDEQAERMARVCCDARFCLKRRLWTAGAPPVDAPADKSVIPCLEPCAVLLEFARVVARLEQGEEATAPWPASEAETAEALRLALERPSAPGPREADFNDQANPRRLLWQLEKMRGTRAGG
jgi:hypothetical protein